MKEGLSLQWQDVNNNLHVCQIMLGQPTALQRPKIFRYHKMKVHTDLGERRAMMDSPHQRGSTILIIVNLALNIGIYTVA